MKKTGVIVLAHGSRGEHGKADVETALKRIAAGLRPLLTPRVEIIGAALQFNQPTLAEATAFLAQKRVDRIVVAPYFLFAGRHITDDIPQLIRRLQCDYPETEFILASNLGLDESFTNLMAKRIKGAVPDIVGDNAAPVTSPIEQESMNIIGNLLPPLPGLSDEELAVIKRIIHTCGDPQVAHLVKFSQSAIRDGLGAITGGSTIFTDVRMVLSGIDQSLAEAFGCSVVCALDNPDLVANDNGRTRTASAIRSLGTKLGGAVVVVGNAPTALLALLDLMEQEDIRPALVVGMPVGFVQAREAKEELMKSQAPYITIAGTRGGSPLAAATINALLRLSLAQANLVVK